MKTLDMRLIRYLNLFEKISGVRTKTCFFYNNMLIFGIQPSFISRAIGEAGKNIKRISEIVGRRVKVIGFPCRNIRELISSVVEPVRFRGIEVQENAVIINAGRQNKAALIGRNRVRIDELNQIVKDYCGKEVRII